MEQVNIDAELEVHEAQSGDAETADNLGEQSVCSDFHIPEKFRDKQTNQVNVQALLKSYIELEKRLSKGSEPASDAEDPIAAISEIVPDSYAENLQSVDW